MDGEVAHPVHHGTGQRHHDDIRPLTLYQGQARQGPVEPSDFLIDLPRHVLRTAQPQRRRPRFTDTYQRSPPHYGEPSRQHRIALTKCSKRLIERTFVQPSLHFPDGGHPHLDGEQGRFMSGQKALQQCALHRNSPAFRRHVITHRGSGRTGLVYSRPSDQMYRVRPQRAAEATSGKKPWPLRFALVLQSTGMPLSCS